MADKTDPDPPAPESGSVGAVVSEPTEYFDAAVEVSDPNILSPRLYKGQETSYIDEKSRIKLPPEFNSKSGKASNLLILVYASPPVQSAFRQAVICPNDRKILAKRFLGIRLEDLLASFKEAPFDEQGRITLGVEVIRNMGLEPNKKHDIVYVGRGDHFEIWPSEQWKMQSTISEARILEYLRNPLPL